MTRIDRLSRALFLVAIVGLARTTAVAAQAGPPAIPVPTLVGHTGEDAEALVRQAGLTPQVTMRTDGLVPYGIVVGQRPEAGQTVAPSTPIVMIVSRGAAPDGRRRRTKVLTLGIVH